MGTIRRIFSAQIPVLLIAATAAAAQIDNSNQSGQPAGTPTGDSAPRAEASTAPPTPTTVTPTVTITPKPPGTDPSLPKPAPNEFTDCMSRVITQGGLNLMDSTGLHSGYALQLSSCQSQLHHEEHIVLARCIDPNANTAPRDVILACTQSLNHSLLPGNARVLLLVNRADAYFTLHDNQRTLADYNEAIRLAPHIAVLYYNRGAIYASQSDGGAALRDFDTAIRIDSEFVAALIQRARIYRIRGNFSGALTDYSAAIRLQPKNAVLWSDRGYVCLRQRDYKGAIEDEAEAIRLDPKLARAYFFRGAAFGELGDSLNAGSDIEAALRLDPSLDSYLTTKVTTTGKSVSITLPPAP